MFGSIESKRCKVKRISFGKFSMKTSTKKSSTYVQEEPNRNELFASAIHPEYRGAVYRRGIDNILRFVLVPTSATALSQSEGECGMFLRYMRNINGWGMKRPLHGLVITPPNILISQ
ncbi:hypothetical protein CBL_12534 [Carabus blaptoides fortunei]